LPFFAGPPGLAIDDVFGLGSGRMTFDPTPAAPRQASIFFERRELNRILSLYGRMVAAGEWRDYAIDGLRDSAVFSVFRRASEAPLYRIEKRPALARAQGAWAVLGQGGVVLRRGHELEQVLKVFDRGRFKVVD
jgi:hypothetical protein